MAVQLGKTSQVHQSHYIFQQDEQVYFQIFLNNKNTINILKNGVIHQSISLASYLKEVGALSVCFFTGDVILVSESNEIYMINYISITQQWILLKRPLFSSSITTEITAIEHLNKKEVLICDILNIAVYKISYTSDEVPSLIRTWVNKNPVSPVFNITKTNSKTGQSNEYMCRKFNLLTYNDSLVYVWKRTVIDVDNDIYSYQLSLINTDKLNSSTVTWNIWSKINNSEIFYTLNDDSILRIWQNRAEALQISLAEIGHQYMFLIKNSKDRNVIVTFGFDSENKVHYSIHEVTFDYNSKKLLLNTVKKNLNFESGVLLPETWSKSDYLEFLVSEKNHMIFFNNFDKQSTAVVDYEPERFSFTLRSVAAGITSNQKIISSTVNTNNFYSQTVTNSNEVTMWQVENNIMHSKVCPGNFTNSILKIVQESSGEPLYLFSDKVVVGDKFISFEEGACLDIGVLNHDNLIVLFKDRIDVYFTDTLKKKYSFDITDSLFSFIHENSVVVVRSEKSKTFIVKYILKTDDFQSFDIKTIEKSFSFDLDTNVEVGKYKNGIIALKNIEHDILFYDVGEMFMLKKLTMENDSEPGDWILDTNGKLWLVVFEDDCIRFYNDKENKIYKTKSKCIDFITIDKKLVLVYDNYFEIIEIENIFNKEAQDETTFVETTIDSGDYTKVGKFFKYLENNITNDQKLNTNTFEENISLIEDIFNNRELWKQTFFFLKVKLQNNHCLLTALIFIDEIINEHYPKTTFFGLNYIYKAKSNDIKIKDSILANFEKEFTTPENIDFSTGFKGIVNSAEQIKLDFDDLCKSLFQETKNPHDVGLYYLAMNKLPEYKLIWKYSTKKEADKINNFLLNYNNKKCLNNGYKLLSLHRYSEACWFFLLGNDYKSCFYTILKKMHDFNLAVAVLKVFDPTGERLKECLQTYCLEYFKDLNKFWEYLYSGLIINNYNMEFVELDQFIVSLKDLECLLMIVKKYGTEDLEQDVLKRITRLATLSNNEKLLIHYSIEYKSQTKIPFILKESIDTKPKAGLFKSFNEKPKLQETLQVTNTEPKSMLDDWM
ncbi:hypothetical protein FOG50_00253 [Hanseniaspora uvarum]|nr:hypothetical protein FOG50_00253 [Hanseniaspora uvarum]